MLMYKNKTGFCVEHNPQRWKVHNSYRQEYFKKWRHANYDCIKATKLKQQYGISLEEFEAKSLAQGHTCYICKKPRTDGKALVVDHCHTTGKVRDLLCPTCNQSIGLAQESVEILESMISYLKKHSK
jgi:hypothetical protein